LKSILDRSFNYTTSVETDLRKTFARVRREQRKQAQAQAATAEEVRQKVLLIATRKSAVQ
jgi:hypothetical protein